MLLPNRVLCALRPAAPCAVITAVLLAVALPAMAQMPQRAFFTVGSLAGFEYRSRPEQGEPFGVTPSIALAIGTALNRRVDLRFETTVASTLKNEYTERIEGSTFHQQLNTHLTLGTVLVGCGLRPYGPLTVRLLFGTGVVSRHTHYEIDSFTAPPPGIPDVLNMSPPTYGDGFDTWTHTLVGSLGFDAEFALWKRVRMVPQVRAHLYSGAWRFDPGMSVRVAF